MKIKKILLIMIFFVFNDIVSASAQNSPIFVWGGGLNGTTYQTTAIYSELYTGLVFEAPLDASGLKLPIQFGWRGGGTSALKILSNGNIGIAIDSPTEKLSVNGKIRAKEIKVEIANWPDYVFAKEYRFPSLLETEKYINENGHLPGIKSAEEVKSNGIDLGEMNAKLLQKIEELTLYLIEEHKTNLVREEELKLQRKMLKTIQNELENLKVHQK